MTYFQNLFSSEDYIPVTPADTDFTSANGSPKFTRQIVIGGAAGTLILTKMDGSVVTLTVAAGQTLNVRAKRIAAASTAGNIIALF